MRFARLVSAALILSFLPLTAFAQTTDTSSLSALLSEIAALEQQLSSLSGNASTSATVASSQLGTSGGSCPVLQRTLSFGSGGSDVAALQVFLAAGGFLHASATGYFGALTQTAVSQWQEQNGVVSGGDATSTGLGVVGPKTRAAIANACGTGQSATQGSAKAQCLSVSPPQTDCPTNWQPVLDAAGCAMYYQCSISLPGTTGAASSSPASPSAPAACPVVQKPVCSGAVTPFQTNANGCILSYQCVI